jgi:hypothetical protein
MAGLRALFAFGADLLPTSGLPVPKPQLGARKGGSTADARSAVNAIQGVRMTIHVLKPHDEDDDHNGNDQAHHGIVLLHQDQAVRAHPSA